MSHSTSVCDAAESKNEGYCGPTALKPPSPETSSNYKESTYLSRTLKATVTSDAASVPPYKVPILLPEDPISTSVVEEPSRSVIEVDRSHPQSQRSRLQQLLLFPTAEQAAVCRLQEFRCGSVHLPGLKTVGILEED